jgi:hypothetical protein
MQVSEPIVPAEIPRDRRSAAKVGEMLPNTVTQFNVSKQRQDFAARSPKRLKTAELL